MISLLLLLPCCLAFLVDGFQQPVLGLSPLSLSSPCLFLSSSSSSETDKGTTSEFGALPVKQGTVQVSRGDDDDEHFNLSYNLVRPMSLSSQQAAPIVVLHGGPSVPSNYCFPLAKHVPYRSILFYDQLGCGKSDEPTNMEHYSIGQAVDDLEVVLKQLSIRRFHLYGQSFGGILAFEYLKRCAEQGNDSNNEDDDEGCLSVILSSTPTNVRQVEEEAQRLIEALPDPELFRETHQCRTPEMPEPLANAYASAGTVWRGTTAIQDYFAQPPTNNDEGGNNISIMPSALVLRGEYDFVTEDCSKDWKKLFNSRSVRERTLQDCSHHGLHENGLLYGDIVDSFFSEYD